MEYLTIAYGFIAIVLGGYGISLMRRTQTARQERKLLEANDQ